MAAISSSCGSHHFHGLFSATDSPTLLHRVWSPVNPMEAHRKLPSPSFTSHGTPPHNPPLLHYAFRKAYVSNNDGAGGFGGSNDDAGGFGGGNNDDAGGFGGNDDGFGKPGGLGLLSSFWFRYMDMLEENPLLIKSITTGFLNFFADLVCQVFFEKVPQLDIQRILSFTALGFFLSGPGLHFWYGLLPKLIPMPGFQGLFLRLCADQIVFTPIALGCVFVALCILEGRQHEIVPKLEKDWLPLVIANWKLWIPFQLINFGLVPSQLQVAATSLMGVAWSIFVSFIGHN